MSSRLMPPKVGATARQKATSSSASWLSRQIGKASTPPNSLKRIALPSITGMAAAAPMSPRPRTAVPFETTAMQFLRIVRLNEDSGSSAMALQMRATPGV
jgi:hypothetical protein